MKAEKNVKSKVLNGMGWSFGGRILTKLLSLMVSIILARILAPTDYGAFAIIMVFIMLVEVLVCNGFGTALVQKENADALDFSSVFYLNFAISIILYMAIYISAPVIAKFYRMPGLTSAMRILGISIPAEAIKSIQAAYVSRNMQFKRLFWSTLLGTIISGAIGILMAYCGFGLLALVAQCLLNICIDTAVLCFTANWHPSLDFSWGRVKELYPYARNLMAASVMNQIFTKLGGLIIGKVYSPSSLAFYNQGEKYPELIVENLNDSFSDVLFPVLSQSQRHQDKLKSITRRSIQLSSYIVWPMMIGLAVVADLFIRVVLTEKWLPCVPYLRIFCVAYGFDPIHVSNLQAIKAAGRIDIFLKLEVAKNLLSLVVLLWSVKYGPYMMAVASIGTDMICLLLNAAPNKKLLNYTIGEQLMDVLPSLLGALGMAAVMLPVRLLGMSDLLTLVVQVVWGAASYFIISILSKQNAFFYLLDSLKNIKK